EGLVLCEEQVCDKLNCQEPVHVQDKCCPQCPEEAENKGTSSPVTFKNSIDGHNKECVSSGKYYVDGSTWHPVIGPFGPMDCVMCKCNAGTIECSRYKCPAVSELPCVKPVTQFGQCCPVCPFKVMSVVQAENGKGEDDGSGLLQCVPNTSELVVYRSHGAGNLSEFLQYAFQHVTNSGHDVDLHSWVMRSGNVHTFQTQTITASDFTELRQKFYFLPVATTTTKRMNKFMKREKKLKQRCKSNCSVKVKQLEDLLIVNKINHRSKCEATERALSSV
ncbi:hypothetical protein L9F63_019545, partial [Diploptera punctata]